MAQSYSIKEVLSISVDSAFHDGDSPAIEIEDYWLTRLSKTTFDVQIDFKEPDQISRSKTEPDVLHVMFTEQGSKFFIDSDDFTQIDSGNLSLETDIKR